MRKMENILQRTYREIAERGEVSIAGLARALGEKVSTVEGKIQVLARRGFVEFRRKRKAVGINPEYGHVVGIDMGGSHLHYALADFRGNILNETTEGVRPEDGPQKLIGQIKKGIEQLSSGPAGGRRNTGSLRALGIGVPSPVDPKTGMVAFANNLPGWKNINLARELARGFRIPVCIENDANMAAIGEQWRGVARGVETFVFIALGTGIGSGVFAGGKLHRGRTGSAGELFRLNVEWQRWDEDFGDTGYFESSVSGLGIAAEGRRTLGVEPSAAAEGLAAQRDAYFVFEAFRQGNPIARAALEKTFVMLGVAMADIVALLDPELIVLGGGVAKGAPEFMLETVEKVVRRIQMEITPAIKLSALGDKAQTFGAIRSALNAAQEAAVRRFATSVS